MKSTNLDTTKKAKELATTLAIKPRTNKRSFIATTQVTPLSVIIEKKYGHTVKTMGRKRIEITPLDELEPVDLTTLALLEVPQKRTKRKTGMDYLKQRLKIYPKSAEVF